MAKYNNKIVILGIIITIILNVFIIIKYVVVTSELSKQNKEDISELYELQKRKIDMEFFFDYNKNIKELITEVKADNKDEFNKILGRIERLESKWINRSRGENEIVEK